MIPGVLLDLNPYQKKTTVENAVVHAQELLQKYQTAKIKKKKVKTLKKHDDILMDDPEDFGMLLDWATHLDEDDLGDFQEIQAM